jgi:predicted DNA-binding protein with PD1-like motif
MKTSEGRLGRIFFIRLEDGDKLPDCIERFAADNNISAGHVIFVGGIGGGQVVVGPRDSNSMPPEPMLLPVDGAHEVLGVGTLASDENGNPVLHMHAAMGRSGNTITGCIRPGVNAWLIGEAIIYEILDTSASRKLDEKSGFKLLDIN